MNGSRTHLLARLRNDTSRTFAQTAPITCHSSLLTRLPPKRLKAFLRCAEANIYPYLAIKFRKDEETLVAAGHQVAVALAMALYNRYLLEGWALQIR